MIVSLIVAASTNEVIGADGDLPWYLPGDLRRFRELTTGHAVVMGRITYESILARLGKPLPGRTSVVVSKSGARSSQAAPGSGGPPGDGTVRWAGSLESALDVARTVAGAAGDREFFVGGGVSVYQDTLPLADRIYLTRVDLVAVGDRSMPAGWLDGFELVRREAADDPRATLRYEWLDYQRVPT